MSIELHCPQCQKLIRAPDTAGGKRGKCPYCGNSVYVPMPPEGDDIIPLAPVDEEEIRREAELRRELTEVTAAVDHMTETIPETDDPPPSDAVPVTIHSSDETDLDGDVEAYVLAMGESMLDAAEAAAESLKSAGPKARKHVREIMRSKTPPSFGSIPPPLVKGFLKTLYDRLG